MSTSAQFGLIIWAIKTKWTYWPIVFRNSNLLCHIVSEGNCVFWRVLFFLHFCLLSFVLWPLFSEERQWRSIHQVWRRTMTSNWPNQSKSGWSQRSPPRQAVKWVSSLFILLPFLSFVLFLWMITVQWPLATTTAAIIHNWPISRHLS